MKKLRLINIYMGGFIGPFAGKSIAVILPNVAESFSILWAGGIDDVRLPLPFATVMLGSTRIVRRFRPRRVILTAYLFTLVGSAICILSRHGFPFSLVLWSWGLLMHSHCQFSSDAPATNASQRTRGCAGNLCSDAILGLFSAP